MSNDTELRAIIRAVDATGPGVAAAKRSIGSLDDVVGRATSGMVGKLAAVTAGFVSLDGAVRLTMAGIRNANDLKDLHTHLQLVDGSLQEAARSLMFFDEAQEQTRRTGEDMVRVYGELLPLAMSKGFSREGFREAVVDLDQFATAVRHMPQEVNKAFEQIMHGKAEDSNIILKALGLDAESVKSGEINAEQLMRLIAEKAEAGRRMGDDFASSLAKMENGISSSFAKGWNDAETETSASVARIRATVEDPAFLGAFEMVGKALRSGLGGIGDFLPGFSLGAIGLGQKVYAETSAVREHVENFFDWYQNLKTPTLNIDPSAIGYGITHPGYRPFRAGSIGLNNETESASVGAGFGAASSAESNVLDFRAAAEKRKIDAAAEAARKLAEAIRLRGEALAFEIQLLKAADPFQRAEIEFMRDLAAGSREATAGLRAMAQERAELVRQGKMDDAFGDLLDAGDGRMRGIFAGAPGVAQHPVIPILVDPAINEATLAAAKERKLREQTELMLVAKWEDAHRNFGFRLSDVFADLALTGGENFGRMASGRFNELVTEGMDVIFGQIFGQPGDPSKLDSFGNPQVRGKLYDTQGRPLSESAARAARVGSAALDLGMLGMGAYSGSYAMDGQRTAGTIGGAMGGASLGATYGTSFGPMGMAVGAVIGAVVGALGSYMGESARHDDYKFGHPNIINGVADIGSAKNLTQYEKEQLIADVQDTYDRTRNAGVRMMMTLGQSFGDDTFGNINGSFQPKPSQHWGKHFTQWVEQGLPDEVMGQMKGQLKDAFGGVGFGGDKFDRLWEQIDKLDPTKAISILSGLAKGLVDLDEAMSFLGADNGAGVNTSWMQGMRDVREEMDMTFAESMREAMDGIIQQAEYLDDLTGEDQIALLQDIGRMSLDIRAREREEMRQIILLQERIKEQSQAALDRYHVMGMVNEDGTQDYEGQAEWFHGKADDAYKRMQNASTREEMEKAYADYMAAIDMIVQLGYQIGPEAGETWRKWAMEQIEKSDAIINKRLEELGKETSAANADFIERMKEIMETFGDAVGDVGTGVGGAKGAIDEFGRRIGGIGGGLDNLSAALHANLSNVVDFGTGLARVNVELQALRSTLSTLRPPGGGSDFGSQTAAARAAQRAVA